MRPYYRKLFLPTGTGFHFGAPVPSDLASPRYLQADDPEDVICSVQANAPQGQFAPSNALRGSVTLSRSPCSCPAGPRPCCHS